MIPPDLKRKGEHRRPDRGITGSAVRLSALAAGLRRWIWADMRTIMAGYGAILDRHQTVSRFTSQNFEIYDTFFLTFGWLVGS